MTDSHDEHTFDKKVKSVKCKIVAANLVFYLLVITRLVTTYTNANWPI